jgi:hypothetical protein
VYYDPLFLGSRTRRVGADGLITIKCRICEKDICREMYRGFSTAICAVCQGEIERGKRPEDLMDEVHAREVKARDDVYDDLGPLGFKVAGLGQRIKEVVVKVKEAAQKRRRSPLFAKKDKEPQK